MSDEASLNKVQNYFRDDAAKLHRRRLVISSCRSRACQNGISEAKLGMTALSVCRVPTVVDGREEMDLPHARGRRSISHGHDIPWHIWPCHSNS